MTEVIYMTDGSLEGLFAAVHEAYYSGENVVDILPGPAQMQNYLVQYKSIAADGEKSDRVYSALNKKVSYEAFEYVRDAWLSELPGIGGHILSYIRLAFRLGRKIDDFLTNADVAAVHAASYKVGAETHRMLGLLRFELTADGIYFAKIDTDHNVIVPIAEHFAQRLGDRSCVIYDTKRKLAALAKNGEYALYSGVDMPEMQLHPEEMQFADMWRRYFDAIAIKERTNTKLQRAFMPKRYWKNLTEKKPPATR